MESIKFIKGGYNKVNPSETPNPPNRRRKIIAISSVIFSTLLLASLLALFIQNSPSKLTPNSSIRTVCAVTRYPDSCFSSLSPLNTPPINDPLHYFNLSLHVSISEVTKIAGLTSLKECAELLDDSVSQLAKSAELMRVKKRGENVLTEMRVSDLLTWISGAMSDVETCVDSLEEMGSSDVDEFKVKVQRAKECMSNSLAILSNVKGLYLKLGLQMP